MTDSVFNMFLIISQAFQRSEGKNITLRNCTSRVNLKVFYEYSLIPGILLSLMFGFLVQRKSFLPEKWRGRPGVAIPMNALEMRRNRIPYLLAYGAIMNMIAYNIFEPSSTPFLNLSETAETPSWAKNFLKILGVLVYGTVAYPLFAGISAESLLGYAVAFCFCIVHFVIQLYNFFICMDQLVGSSFAGAFLNEIPAALFLSLLLCYLPYLVYLRIQNKEAISVTSQRIELENMREYVKHLLRLNITDSGKFHNLTQKLKELKLGRLKGFYFPPRFLCSLLVAIVLIYMISIQYVVGVSQLIYILQRLLTIPFIEQDKRTVREVFQNIANSSEEARRLMSVDLLRLTIYFLDVIKICFFTAYGIISFYKILEIFWICLNLRRNILLAYAGKYPNIAHPSTVKPATAIRGFSRFAGFQAAFLLWGFVIQVNFLFFVFLVIACVVVIPIVNGFGQFWLDFIVSIWPLIIITIALFIIQIVVVKYFFTQSNSVISVDNRQAFFVWTYYMFFFDIFMGIVACIIRIFKSVIFGVLIVGRMDYSVTCRQFEFMDKGFACYCSYVLTEVVHSNPIARIFLDTLYNDNQQSTIYNYRNSNISSLGLCDSSYTTNMALNDTCFGVQTVKKDLRAKIRWHLFYTLLKNPSLRVQRKHFILRAKEGIEQRKTRLENGTLDTCL